MDRRDKKKINPGAIIAIAIALFAAEPRFFAAILGIAVILAILASPILIIRLAAKNKDRSSGRKGSPSGRTPAFDDCPKTFCFHKDRGEHHIRKGKETDPWDRPDIDISKYQRRQ